MTRRIVDRLLRPFDMKALKHSELRALNQRSNDADKLALLEGLPAQALAIAVPALLKSKSQIGQDIFALLQSGWKQGGFFVDFGATDGKTLSNSWLLEKEFGWTGILAEPARGWHEKLLNSGRTASIELNCVWDRTGEELVFHETDFAELSTVGTLLRNDYHDRRSNARYTVRTISFNDLLAKYQAPQHIGLLSIDTEGSELRILSSIDFDRYSFGCIVCEHNFTPEREAIHSLLVGQGYRRVRQDQSKWDDWYVGSATA